ncbi:aldehyde dehydrogenase family protein [Saccharospirillum impatiens]|uniref:aldehyde dehydrogenase family protein n=1 Tax=Saccharospirillum impatiens TaxID=169438 RepID=UPI0003FFA3A8|nr:aldehyde dehydrogenase family protein [Saccharospirillum impatiens]
MSVFRSVNPASQECLFEAKGWSQTETIGVLNRQQQAWPALSAIPLTQRIQWLSALAGLLDEHQDTLARQITREMGKPLTQSLAELHKTIALIGYLVEQGPGVLSDTGIHADAALSFEPWGGILGIMPWNYPVWQVCRFALPALLAGNTVAIKPAPNVWLSSRLLVNLIHEAGFPEEAVALLQIDPEDLPAVYDHPHLRQVHFTGSSNAGRAIAMACAERLIPSTLELGGSDVWLLTDSGDLNAFVDNALASRLNNSGQSCLCAKRWLVPASRLDAVLARVQERLAHFSPTEPEAPGCTLGPLARVDIRDRLLQQWHNLKVTATRHSEDPTVEGLYVSPAWAVTDDPMTSPVWPDEIFGPVLQLAAYESVDQAVLWANRSRYGLGGAVWSNSVEESTDIARRLTTRNVAINKPMRSRIDVPFGGMGESGWGVELGASGLQAITRRQTRYF